jgi:Trk-type K+ transport system membrane component
MTAGLGTLIIGMTGMSLLDSFYLCISSLTTTGTGLYSAANVASIPIFAQAIVCALMWIGRMEITLALSMFTIRFWKESRIVARNSIYDTMDTFRKT